MSEPIQIAVDAMGGDRAPNVVVEGSLAALEDYPELRIQLVGRPEAIEPLLGASSERVSVVPATDVIGMEEHPGKAVRKKPQSSIAVCGRLLAERKVAALVSAGNTGAVIAASMFAARLLPGVHRPGIAVAFPNSKGGITVLCDVGANINMKPVHYLQYAVMASAYSHDVLGVEAPKVGLLNIGTEASKGGAELAAVRQQLEQAGDAGLIDFIGAVEGNHIFEGAADVVVCDGFVGNTVLKSAEGAARVVLLEVARILSSDSDLNGSMQKALGRLHEFSDYSTYGGAPLLGIDGCAIIAHGRSDAKAIKHAIRVAHDFAQREVNRHIVERLERLGELATGGVAK